MSKYLIIFAFILSLMQAHALGATEANNTIKGIDDKETIKSENGNWTGIDESIVGKYAEKFGHPPRDPYINTDQGDLLLFVFTFFGLIGGIIIGYNFRKLFVEGKDQDLHRKDAKIAKTKQEKRFDNYGFVSKKTNPKS